MGLSSGFNAGFAKGLAGVLTQKRQQDLELERENRGRQDKLAGVLLETLIPRAERPDDVVAVMAQMFPEFAKDKNLAGLLQTGLSPLYGSGGPSPAAGAGGLAAGTPTSTPVGGSPLGVGGAPKVGAVGALAAGEQAAGTPAPTDAPRSGFRSLDEAEMAPHLAEVRAQPHAVAARRRIAETTPEIAALSPQEKARYVLTGELARYGAAGSALRSVPGELADGTAAYGVFNPQTGQYIDPDTGEPIPNFRPRTTTGSRTLGGDREALSMEMFGKQASQLTADEMAQLNAALPDYLARLAHGRGTGTGQAKIETAQQMPLSPEQAAVQGVPMGTTPASVAGQTPQTKEIQDIRRAMTTMQPKLDALERAIRTTLPAAGDSLVGQLKAQGEVAWNTFRKKPEIAALQAMVQGLAGDVATVVQQQKGQLSDNDRRYALAQLAELDSWQPDTQESAIAKVGVLRQILGMVQTNLPAQMTPGAAPASPTAATPKARAAPTGTKPKVTNAAPTAQKVGGAWVIP